jgi:hypothetical protein
LVDELVADKRDLILVMGKGGVEKITIAAAIAVEIAARGHAVHLTATDPAAHIAATIEGQVANLRIAYGRELMHLGCYYTGLWETAADGISVGIIRNAVETPLLIVAPAFSTARSGCL